MKTRIQDLEENAFSNFIADKQPEIQNIYKTQFLRSQSNIDKETNDYQKEVHRLLTDKPFTTTLCNDSEYYKIKFSHCKDCLSEPCETLPTHYDMTNHHHYDNKHNIKNQTTKHLNRDDNLQCDECGQRFWSEHFLYMHFKTHHSKSTLPSTCGSDYTTKKSIQKQNGNKEARTKSATCMRKVLCVDDNSLNKEKGRIESGSSKETKFEVLSPFGCFAYKCVLCSQGFQCEKSFASHFRQSHTGVYRYISHNCGAGFHEKDYFKENGLFCKETKSVSPNCGSIANSDLSRSMPNQNTETQKEKYKCDICGNDFENSLLLERHIMLHEKNKIRKKSIKRKFYKSRMFRNQGDYSSDEQGHYNSKKKKTTKDHDGEVLDKQNLNCPYCVQVFSNNMNLRNHLPVHLSDVKIHFCHFCGQRFNKKDQLGNHLKSTHHNESPSEKIQFISNHHLNADQESTERTEIYSHHQCDICDMTFITDKELKSHIAIHLDNQHAAMDISKEINKREKTLLPENVQNHTNDQASSDFKRYKMSFNSVGLDKSFDSTKFVQIDPIIQQEIDELNLEKDLNFDFSTTDIGLSELHKISPQQFVHTNDIGLSELHKISPQQFVQINDLESECILLEPKESMPQEIMSIASSPRGKTGSDTDSGYSEKKNTVSDIERVFSPFPIKDNVYFKQRFHIPSSSYSECSPIVEKTMQDSSNQSGSKSIQHINNVSRPYPSICHVPGSRPTGRSKINQRVPFIFRKGGKRRKLHRKTNVNFYLLGRLN